MALFGRLSQLHIAYAGFVKQLFDIVLALVSYLDDDTGILSKEELDKIILLETIKVDFKTSVGVGKAHFEQAGDQTTGRDVMPSQDKSALDEFLHRIKGIAEIIGVRDCRDVAADTAQRLRKGRTAEPELVETEINVIECSLAMIDEYGRNHLAHVAHFAAGRHDHRAGRNDFLPVGILLRHGEGILSRRHVDVQGAAIVAQSLDCGIEAGVFSFLRTAGPHPVG